MCCQAAQAERIRIADRKDKKDEVLVHTYMHAYIHTYAHVHSGCAGRAHSHSRQERQEGRGVSPCRPEPEFREVMHACFSAHVCMHAYMHACMYKKRRC